MSIKLTADIEKLLAETKSIHDLEQIVENNKFLTRGFVSGALVVIIGFIDTYINKDNMLSGVLMMISGFGIIFGDRLDQTNKRTDAIYELLKYYQKKN